MQGRVLIIAGSDSGGGAGIQADIKAVMALDGYAATAITALTAQNTLGVFGVHPVPLDFLAQQMTLVLDDIGADCVKTGMLASAAVIETVMDVLERYPGLKLVCDPVMIAKGGAPLLDPDAVATMKNRMLPRASLITPNLPEAEALSGRRIATPEDMRQAGPDLLALGPQAVLLKGGHLEGDTVVDMLFTAEGVREYSHPRILTANTHGTGCTLASAIAAGIAQGMPLAAAVERGRDYVRKAIETAPNLGKGHGPLNHAHTVRPFGLKE
ncbi:bifunctional hydroxymethylpyrimidine kinase/phosphomethylpyrimidine kinase [Telmatospirillum sp. J64-1]|uniref:bifunctional hydroxymethylpyrimidine kinase/phosphomethylpyrimidine kinase n=1 Tax=Telmatospirillum sp. J64-1 TaxID=2502183 RepID=UPI00115D825F|nr:bifunctional hydroxymethylpyrimidine kinase/phosphomethylpyrimidine kinase [Telmatospirillum sp. J64-1]